MNAGERNDLLKRLNFWAQGYAAADAGANPCDCPHPVHFDSGTPRREWQRGLADWHIERGRTTPGARRALRAWAQEEIRMAPALSMKPVRIMIAILVAAALLSGCGSSSRLEAPECSGNTRAANAEGFRPVIWDDGSDTYLRFPGNQRIPAITALREDRKEGAVNTNADPDRGEVRVHGVHPGIVLRDGNRVACLLNRAYDPVGYRPPGGTT